MFEDIPAHDMLQLFQTVWDLLQKSNYVVQSWRDKSPTRIASFHHALRELGRLISRFDPSFNPAIFPPPPFFFLPRPNTPAWVHRDAYLYVWAFIYKGMTRFYMLYMITKLNVRLVAFDLLYPFEKENSVLNYYLNIHIKLLHFPVLVVTG